MRLVGEPKKTKKQKRRRHPKQWQTGYSPRPPTSSDQNQTLHGGWHAVCSYTCKVSSKSVKGLRRCGVDGPSPLWDAMSCIICFNILLYADDILLLAPSVSALQSLLHVCEQELLQLDMTINVRKSSCTRIGARYNAKCCCITTLNGAA